MVESGYSDAIIVLLLSTLLQATLWAIKERSIRKEYERELVWREDRLY